MSALEASFRTRWMRAVALSSLTPTRKLVAFTIGQRMSASGEAWPSLARIAAESSLDLATVKRAKRELVAAGFLSAEVGGGRGRANRYLAEIPAHIAPLLGAETGAQDLERGAQDQINRRTSNPRSRSTEVHIEDAARDWRETNAEWAERIRRSNDWYVPEEQEPRREEAEPNPATDAVAPEEVSSRG